MEAGWGFRVLKTLDIACYLWRPDQGGRAGRGAATWPAYLVLAGVGRYHVRYSLMWYIE